MLVLLGIRLAILVDKHQQRLRGVHTVLLEIAVEAGALFDFEV
jgi:hypothetical protein